MLPIDPAAKYATCTQRSPAPESADIVHTHRTLASRANLSTDERAAMRRALVIALVVLLTGAAISVALAPGTATMVAQLGN